MSTKGITQKVVLVDHIPKGMPNERDFRVEERQLPQIKDGELLYESLYLSPDPYQRACLHQLKQGDVMVGSSVVRVLDSKIPDFKKGDLLVVHKGWVSHGILTSDEAKKVHRHDKSLGPIPTALGVLGLPGMNAYFGMLRVCQPKHGETVVITGAAGAVGSLAGQIAKIKGARVIGITGSQEKCDYLKSIGFDETINYKDCKDLKTTLDKICPQGVDCCFDNVGGEILDCVLRSLNTNARIALSGQISQYNKEDMLAETGPRLLFNLILKNARLEGFIVFRWVDEFPEATRKLSKWIKSGKIKYNETIEKGGIEATPKAFISMLSGGNIGKQLVQVSSSPEQ